MSLLKRYHINQVLNTKNFSFIVSRTVACAHMPVYAYACLKHVHVELEHECAYACPRVSMAFLFQK